MRKTDIYISCPQFPVPVVLFSLLEFGTERPLTNDLTYVHVSYLVPGIIQVGAQYCSLVVFLHSRSQVRYVILTGACLVTFRLYRILKKSDEVVRTTCAAFKKFIHYEPWYVFDPGDELQQLLL